MITPGLFFVGIVFLQGWVLIAYLCYLKTIISFIYIIVVCLFQKVKKSTDPWLCGWRISESISCLSNRSSFSFLHELHVIFRIVKNRWGQSEVHRRISVLVWLSLMILLNVISSGLFENSSPSTKWFNFCQNSEQSCCSLIKFHFSRVLCRLR